MDNYEIEENLIVKPRKSQTAILKRATYLIWPQIQLLCAPF